LFQTKRKEGSQHCQGERINEIMRLLDDRAANWTATTRQNLMEIIGNEMKANAENTYGEAFSVRTVEKYVRVVAKEVMPQYKTKVRKEAAKDIRNQVTLIAATHVAVTKRGTKSKNIINMDATAISTNFAKVKHKIFISRDSTLRKVNISWDKDWGGPTVKFFMFSSEEGVLFPPVIVVAVDSMHKEQVKVNKVRGCCQSRIQEEYEYCYIVRMKNRTGNRKFYKWLFQKYLIEQFKSVDSDEKSSRVFVADGEAIQLKYIMSADVQADWDGMNIMVKQILLLIYI